MKMNIPRSSSNYYLNSTISHSGQQFFGMSLFQHDWLCQKAESQVDDVDIHSLKSSQSIEFDEKMDTMENEINLKNSTDNTKDSTSLMDPLFGNFKIVNMKFIFNY